MLGTTGPLLFKCSIIAEFNFLIPLAFGVIDSEGDVVEIQCHSPPTACAVIRPPLLREVLTQKKFIKDYMRENFESWVDFAKMADAAVGSEEVLFVSETLKVTRWALLLLNTTGQRLYGNLDLDWERPFPFDGTEIPAGHSRYGPTTTWTGEPISRRPRTPEPDDADQCLFIHYFKMRRRPLTHVNIHAAAGPSQLPPGPPSSGSDAEAAKVRSQSAMTVPRV